MNEAALAELARLIVQKELFGNVWFYITLIALAGVGAMFSSFIRSYGGEQGKFKAIQENFDEVKHQLAQTTFTAKTVEMALAHSDWSVREYKTLRREKLEEVMLTLYATRSWLARQMTAPHETVSFEPADSPIDKLDMLVTLYFPELQTPGADFFLAHQAMIVAILGNIAPVRELNLRREMLKTQIETASNLANPQPTVQELLAALDVASNEYIAARRAFQDSLIPLYRDLQQRSAGFSTAIKAVMSEVITPSAANSP
ncbi:hypothetical protein GTP45_08055 [Pseudoduganella sp. FT55W]|uniref:Uncharacterized protein n=1 Tax=Duganella rivi TaxID=2666083 RepID=A0A7X4GQH0_9BURK|nr:hypothetical protein [Duganella rivi]MYM66779.1 hypothetical protein [Duganella rivi]